MYQPSHALTFVQAQSALDEGLRAIEGGQTHIDLSKIVAIDSSAVAVLLSWQRAARKASVDLCFVSAPGNLINLIDVYGVADLLTLGAVDAAITQILPTPISH